MATGPQVTTLRGINRIQPGAISQNDSSPQIPVGTLSFDGNNLYKYVKYLGNNAIAVGDTLCYDDSDTSGFTAVDGFNRKIGAGIACCVAASGSVSYGWMQVKGVSQITAGSVTNGIVSGNTVSVTGAPSKQLKVISLVTDLAVGTVIVAATPTIVCDFPWL